MNQFIPALILSVLAASHLQRAAAEPPNILWIVAEDINPHLRCFGDTNALTPTLDRFAERSLRFPNCWSAAPVCAPARTALISGVYPPSLGAEHMRSLVQTPEPIAAYPQLLRDLGYYCINNSKEDYNLKLPARIWDGSSNRAHWTNRPAGKPFFAAFNYAVSHEGQIRSRTGPLKHDPATIRLPAYHPDTPEVRRDWARYHDNITEMDAMIAERLEELKAAGVADNTIVFFYGDNGSGMPRSKRWPYNSGLNVPLIVHVPAQLMHLAPRGYEAGGISKRLVSFVDFAPTLVSIAGEKPPSWMQGRAFMGAHPAEPPPYLFGFRGRMDERYDLVRSVRDDRYIYIRNYLPHLIYGQHIAYMFETPTTRVWKQLFDQGDLRPPQTFFWKPKPAEELYDLQNDPDEVRNLAESADHAQTRNRLRQALSSHLRETRDLGFITEAEQQRRAGDNRSVLATRLACPLERVFEAADRASLPELAAVPDLLSDLKNPESAIRYWSVIGLMLRGSNAVAQAGADLRLALHDESPSVQVAAARALGLYGNQADLPRSLAILENLAAPDKNGVFVSLEALGAIEALGPQADPIKPSLETLSRQDPNANNRTQGYAGRFLDYLVGKGNETPAPAPRKKARK